MCANNITNTSSNSVETAPRTRSKWCSLLLFGTDKRRQKLQIPLPKTLTLLVRRHSALLIHQLSKNHSLTVERTLLGPLFELDTIEVSEFNLQKYPFDTLSMEQVRNNFSFMGLPKAVFSRYLDSHRIAVALKMFAAKHIANNLSRDDAFTSAQLLDSHAMSALTPMFPPEVLNIPYSFILGKLPHPSEHASVSVFDDEDLSEETIDLKSITNGMTPPLCFGRKKYNDEGRVQTPDANTKAILLSPTKQFTPHNVTDSPRKEEDKDAIWSVNLFASELLVTLFQVSKSADSDLAVNGMVYLDQLLTSLIFQLRRLSEEYNTLREDEQIQQLKRILCQCLLVKVICLMLAIMRLFEWLLISRWHSLFVGTRRGFS